MDIQGLKAQLSIDPSSGVAKPLCGSVKTHGEGLLVCTREEGHYGSHRVVHERGEDTTRLSWSRTGTLEPCDAEANGARCSLNMGHDGDHRGAGGWTWRNERAEYLTIKVALALHRSMAQCGEKPSPSSEAVFQRAMRIVQTQLGERNEEPAEPVTTPEPEPKADKLPAGQNACTSRFESGEGVTRCCKPAGHGGQHYDGLRTWVIAPKKSIGREAEVLRNLKQSEETCGEPNPESGEPCYFSKGHEGRHCSGGRMTWETMVVYERAPESKPSEDTAPE